MHIVPSHHSSPTPFQIDCVDHLPNAGWIRIPMDLNLFAICALTFVIHLVGTLAYSVRIAGVRTRRIAVSFALFNVLVLISRTSNSFQSPFLAKRIERNISHLATGNIVGDFRWLLWSATVATLFGAILIPSFQRAFSRAVLHFQTHRSIPKLLLRMCHREGLAGIKDSISVPARGNISSLGAIHTITIGTIVLNIIAVSFWTVGAFAALYAGYLNPQLRVTSNSLSSVVNGFSTILMFVLIDPQLSLLTDDVLEGRQSEAGFRRTIVWLTGSRFVGTILAQFLLVPAASLIVAVAERL
jgi:hypothetical protein